MHPATIPMEVFIVSVVKAIRPPIMTGYLFPMMAHTVQVSIANREKEASF